MNGSGEERSVGSIPTLQVVYHKPADRNTKLKKEECDLVGLYWRPSPVAARVRNHGFADNVTT